MLMLIKRTRFIRALGVLALVIVLGVENPALGESYSVELVHDGNTQTLQAAVWVPDDVDRIRGMIVRFPGLGGDTRHYIRDIATQEFARALGFGIISLKDTGGWGGMGDYQGATTEEVTDNLQAFLDGAAVVSNRPEISNAPIAAYGVSKGGWVASSVAALAPSRVISFFSDKSGTWYTPTTAESQNVPGLFVAGMEDQKVPGDYVARSAYDWRVDGGAAVGLAVDWLKGHDRTNRELLWAFIAQNVNARYPAGQVPSLTPGEPLHLNPIDQSDGWLVEANPFDGTYLTPLPWPEIGSHDSYTKDANVASWVVDETMARVLRAHNETDANGNIESNPFAKPFSFGAGGLVNLGIELGDSFDLVVSLGFMSPVDLQNIQQIELYDGSELIDIPDDFLSITDDFFSTGRGVLEYTPTWAGVHTFIAEMTYLNGQTIERTAEYRTVFVQVPEPASLCMFVAAGLAMLHKRRHASK